MLARGGESKIMAPTSRGLRRSPKPKRRPAKKRVLKKSSKLAKTRRPSSQSSSGVVEAALAAVGEKVLLIDSDPQGNASTGLGIGRAQRTSTLYDVIMGEKPIADAVVPTKLPGLDLLPSDPDLSGVELELGHQPGRSFKLRDALASYVAAARRSGGRRSRSGGAGTGPARRDVTVEATEAVCHKMMPGFGELMRSKSLTYVPTAILSRQTAGIRNGTLIVNLPGKPKSIRECLDAVFPAIPYCIDLIGGPFLECNEDVMRAFRPKTS